MVAMKVTFQVITCALILTMFVSRQAWGEDDCYDKKVLLIMHCKDTIQFEGAYVDPTNKCRSVVEASDMACVCLKITIKEQYHINARKIIRLARDCGKPLPVGSKCGSKCVIIFIFIFKEINCLSIYYEIWDAKAIFYSHQCL